MNGRNIDQKIALDEVIDMRVPLDHFERGDGIPSKLSTWSIWPRIELTPGNPLEAAEWRGREKTSKGRATPR